MINTKNQNFYLLIILNNFLGEACAGFSTNPEGKRILNYYWNIGKDTNNKAEAYALLKGLQLTKTRQISDLNVIGDSKTIIRMMI
jgi:ribonuclease HI